MTIDKQLYEDIDSVQQNPQKDAACKRLLAHKVFLAWIMKTCLKEYQNCSVDEIIEQYIEGEPWVNQIPIDKDKTNPIIKGEQNEDTSINEGKAVYDILFYAVKPGSVKSVKEYIRLLINIEPQTEWYNDYPIMKRAIYYTSRMISSQKGRDFFNSDYGKISKVASIWLCIDTPKYLHNTINYYEMQERQLVGNMQMPKETYDLQTVALICLGKPEEDNYNGTLEMLEILLSTERNIEEKEKLLKSKFNIVMTPKMKEEAQIMGSYGLGMLEKGKREGISIGIEKGIEQGIEQGIEKGRFEERLSNIQSLITTLRLSAEQAMDALNIPQEERSQYLTKLKHLN